MAELDPVVIDISKKWLGSIHKGAFSDPRLEVKIGDGYQGWPGKAPFDGIVVTAAAPQVPLPLVNQLKPGGRMVIPVGPSFAEQELVLIEKRADGRITQRTVLPVRFVPMTGEAQRPWR